jgi:hypothetical protein
MTSAFAPAPADRPSRALSPRLSTDDLTVTAGPA